MLFQQVQNTFTKMLIRRYWLIRTCRTLRGLCRNMKYLAQDIQRRLRNYWISDDLPNIESKWLFSVGDILTTQMLILATISSWGQFLSNPLRVILSGCQGGSEELHTSYINSSSKAVQVQWYRSQQWADCWCKIIDLYPCAAHSLRWGKGIVANNSWTGAVTFEVFSRLPATITSF